MSKIKVELNTPVVNGKQVSFFSPCKSTEADSVVINNIEYALVDANGGLTKSAKSAWSKGALVSVILDTSTNKAYVQNATSNAYIEETFVKKTDVIDILHGGTQATNVKDARTNLGFVTGSYEGTGSARTINIQGAENAKVIFIWCDNLADGHGSKGYVTPQGGVMTCGTINDQAFNAETVGIRSYSKHTGNICSFENGTLTIGNMSSSIAMNYINANKVIYYFQAI